jgi:hypothetical protein
MCLSNRVYSSLLASGVSNKVTGNRLGHSKVSITLDLYVMESVDREAAKKIDMIIRNNNKTPNK